MRKIFLVTAVLLGAASASYAGVQLRIGLSLPLAAPAPLVTIPPPIYYQAPPVYSMPAPVVMAPPTVIYQSPPVVYAPAPSLYLGFGSGWGFHGWRGYHHGWRR